MKVNAVRVSSIVGLTLLLVSLSGCGGGESPGDNAGNASATGAGTGGESEAVPPGPSESCPLTAEEVSEVLGVAVQQDTTTCMFEPEAGINPTVLYVRQVSFACSDAVVKDPSFTLAPFEGLGIRAFASATGGDVLVCTNPPFEITVDITPDLDAVMADSDAADAAARASERAAAEQLARLILGR